MRLEIRVAGFGGQGIIRTGLMLAIAACIHGDKNAVQTQSYGPESRGGACKSEVVISDEKIDFPKVVDPDVLIAMSQEAYDMYVDTVKKSGTILLDPDLVQKQKASSSRVFKVPATRMAEQLGKTIVANVVMLGAFTSLTNLVSVEALKKSVLDNVPKGTEKLNLAAFEKGYAYGKRLLKEK
ncbi:MAG: 2-oxoacid:ferredoxin oxidoreductase subunit gamma [Candidatus Bathyarchaeota archaeon]|nr:MAG: 2-oxoacid:ferredoxin oxidoreductase subunit gamma [Candidatus Bathyarchaeota archaeon]